jgi:uncharacterized membrane protein YhaH (DUF805 family)
MNCAIVTQVVDHVTDIPIAHPLVPLVALLDLAISVRRLHDLDLSGWWVLLAVIPEGRIFLIAWFCLRHGWREPIRRRSRCRCA